MFSPVYLAKATRKEPVDLPFHHGWYYGAAIDPGTRSNAWTLVVSAKVDGDTEASARFAVAFVRQWQGTSSEPLRAKQVFAEIAVELKKYAITSMLTDQWGFDPFRELAEDAGLELVLDTRGTTEKMNGFEAIRTKIVSAPPLISVHPNEVLRRDLLNTNKKLTSTGIVPEFIKTSDGRHADYSPALERSIYACSSGPGWVEAMKSARKKGFFS
jgi:hypothetical protein